MHSAEIVKLAAAKRKEKENEQQVYSASSSVNSKDELAVLFAGKRTRQRQFLSHHTQQVETQQKQQQQQQQQNEDPIQSDLMKVLSSIEKENEQQKQQNKQIDKQHSIMEVPALTDNLYLQNESVKYVDNKTPDSLTRSSKTNENKHDKTNTITNAGKMENFETKSNLQNFETKIEKPEDINLLLALLTLSLESEMPAQFYQRLFEESQIRYLMKRSQFVRSAVEVLFQIQEQE